VLIPKSKAAVEIKGAAKPASPGKKEADLYEHKNSASGVVNASGCVIMMFVNFSVYFISSCTFLQVCALSLNLF
jgi:hypothetical protein